MSRGYDDESFWGKALALTVSSLLIFGFGGLLLFLWPPVGDGSQPASQAVKTVGSTPRVSYGTALDEARDTATATPHLQGYERDGQFGDWANSPELCGYGTTRDVVLRRDMTNVVMTRSCKVASGDFSDPYTGRSMHFMKGRTSSMAVQIDHIVAVQDAWASGLWRPERAGDRTRYYNDPDVLQASDAASNEAKGAGVDWDAASDPVWLPSNAAWRCDYMARRAWIKHKYRLTMSPPEKAQTVALLTQCATYRGKQK